MVFSSIDFLFVFLPSFLLCQIFLPWRNLTIVVFSAIFYFYGEGWYSAVVLTSLAMNYAFGRWIEQAQGVAARKLVVSVALTANLTLLVAFKYLGLLVTTFLDVPPTSRMISLHLPLGVSFFTFHSMSYLIDIYRKDALAERSFVNLSVYILMFPQLISGPILRYWKISSQLRERVISSKEVFNGAGFFVIGLAQKVLVADTLAGVADPLFADVTHMSTTSAWLAVLSYTLQIYFDFGGYSNMAIGLGLMCGFNFPVNFNYPYISQSITEFWRRWHITLSSWFRDYLYKPLGGNRHGAWKTYRNLFTVFVLCGLWHGAAWNFALWGLYHGCLLVIERIGFAKVLLRLPPAIRCFYALLTIMIGWVMFRVDNVDQATTIYRAMFTPTSADGRALHELLNGETATTLVAAIVLSTPILVRILGPIVALPRKDPMPEPSGLAHIIPAIVIGAILFALSAIKIYTGAYSPFIYYRF